MSQPVDGALCADNCTPLGEPADRAVAACLPRWAIPATILALLGLAWFFRTGVIASDDTFYLDIARHWQPGAERTAPAHMYGRILFWMPIRLMWWISGDVELSLLVPALCWFVVALGAVSLLARTCFSPIAAWVGVIAFGLTTQVMITASIALPDLPATGVMLLAIAAGGPLLVERSQYRVVLRAVIAGLLIGLGYAVKEFVVIALPGMAMFVLLRRARQGWAWRRLAWIAAAAACCFVAETLLWWHWTGDPIFRLHAVRDSQNAYGMPVQALDLPALLNHWTEYARWLADPGYAYRWWGPAFVVTFAVAAARCHDRRRLLLCITLPIAAMLSIGSTDWHNYAPVWHHPRYLIPVIAVAAVLLGDLAELVRHRARALVKPFACAFAVLCLASLAWVDRESGAWYAAPQYGAARQLFAAQASHWPERLAASGQTEYRLRLIAEQNGVGPIQRIGRAPATPREWVERFGGHCIFVSQPDRESAGATHTMTTLTPDAYAALAEFDVVASAAPPPSPVRRLLAAIGLVEPAVNTNCRTDVIRIPLEVADAHDASSNRIDSRF